MTGRATFPRRVAGLACVVAVLASACSPVERDRMTRGAAKSAILPVVEELFPNVPLDRSLDCIVGFASTDEIDGLASDTLTGPTAATRATVAGILDRPGTRACIAG